MPTSSLHVPSLDEGLPQIEPGQVRPGADAGGGLPGRGRPGDEAPGRATGTDRPASPTIP